MATTPEFPALVRLIDERAGAFRAAAASAPSLEAQVPSCPEWVLRDLVEHLGKSHRRWSMTVAAGPADGPPTDAELHAAPAPPREREALLAWSAESTQQLLTSLRESGPDRGCWTWWDRSQTPQTSGAVARHQVQHVAVHTFDAQLTQGAAQPLPDDAALDGVEEFLYTCCAGTYSWPYEPAAVEYHATEGRSWHVSLAADGVRATRLPTPAQAQGVAPDAAMRGTASDLVLALYGRAPLGAMELDGDVRIFDLLLAWDPDA